MSALSDELAEAAAADGLELRFRAEGDAYERAKAVADGLGLDMKTYLLLCIREGHLVLKAQAARQGAEADLETPAITRRPPPQDPRDFSVWQQVRALFD